MLRKAVNDAVEVQSGEVAGFCAIAAGICWLAWIVATNTFPDAAEKALGESPFSKMELLLMAGWNLLLIPASLELYRRLRRRNPEIILLVTVCGIISLAFWAYGAVTRGITPASEITYLLLSGIWWTGIGWFLRSDAKVLGTFTVVLGAFSILDAVLSLFEPMPFYIYVLAAPKLPLSIIWDFCLGVYLIRTSTNSDGTIPR